MNPYLEEQRAAAEQELPARAGESELTDAQLERQDFVESVIHKALQELAEKELEFDLSLIRSVRDVIEEEFVRRGIMTEMEFFPYIEEEVDQ